MPSRRYTIEQFRAALDDPDVRTLADLCHALGLVPRGANYATLRDVGARIDVDIDHVLAWRRLDRSDDELRLAADGAETLTEIAQRLGLPVEQRVRQVLRVRLERLGLPMPPRSEILSRHGSMAARRVASYTDEALAEAIQREDVHGYPDLCRVLGLRSLSATHQRLRKKARERGLSIPPEWSRSGSRASGAQAGTYPEAAFRVAVKDALCMADAIRVMGDQPKASTWRRARLTVERFQIDTSHLRPQEVEVDHIDGDPWNNLLDNLRLLCPNCHALTKTYRGRNIGRTNGRPRAPTETSAEEGPEQQGG